MNDRLRSALGRTAECPGVETLAEARNDAKVQRHLETCSFCRAELQLLQEFEAAEPLESERASVDWIVNRLRQPESAAAPERRPSAWQRVMQWLAAAFGPGRRSARGGPSC